MNKLLHLGINDSLQSYQKSLVFNTNLVAVFQAVFALVALLLTLFYQPESALFALILFIPSVLAWMLNSQNLSIFARPAFLISGILVVTSFHAYFLLPEEDIIFHFLFIQFNFFIVCWVMIDVREHAVLFPTIILMLVIFFSFQWINARLDAAESMNVLRATPVKIASYFAGLAIVFYCLYTIQKRNVKSEEGVEKLKNELEAKSDELKAKEEELNNTLEEISKTHKEEDKHNWISNGLTRINTILRGSDENIYRKVLLGIIDHADLLYGGIYEQEEENGKVVFYLKASYGFDKAAMEKKRIELDGGLLATAYHERDIIHLTEIPEKYSKIESGLGEAHPACLIALPLIYEGEIEGIIELASFHLLEEHEVDFIKRVGVILARFIESYKSDSRTKELLEKTQQQTEEMRAQEEEMRQNMEELQATQEELHRKEQEYIAKIESLEKQLGK